MKNKSSVWVILTLITLIAFAATGCFSSPPSAHTYGENKGKFGELTRTPAKDFVSMGLVFSEASLTNPSSKNNPGQIFMYQALLQEAKKVGADAIINVVIDKKTQITENDKTETWYGSALAIKYTDTLRQTISVTIDNKTTQTTSVIFNEDANSAGAASGRQNIFPFASSNQDQPAAAPKGIRQ